MSPSHVLRVFKEGTGVRSGRGSMWDRMVKTKYLCNTSYVMYNMCIYVIYIYIYLCVCVRVGVCIYMLSMNSIYIYVYTHIIIQCSITKYMYIC